jgi:hypothetical protein
VARDVKLVISDLHAPYGHIDTLPFLREVKKKYKPNHVLATGDEADKHASSFHDHDADLPSAGDELELAIDRLAPVYRLFPEVDVLESNHGSLIYRKAKHHGISRKYLREYGDVLRAPKGWRWHVDLVVRTGGRRIYFNHGISADVLKVVQSRGMCVVQGHYHTKFEIKWTSHPDGYLWGMTVGCLIDNDQPAFAYNKQGLVTPILGVGVIIDGRPHLVPMELDKKKRWNGEVG